MAILISTIKNLTPENSTFLTSLWTDFHNGSFDTFDRTRPASLGVAISI